MKKTAFLLMAAMMLLCACNSTRVVELHGKTYTVDQEAQTVTCDGVSYIFDVEFRDAGGYTISFTAPDGSTASWTWRNWKNTGRSGEGSWSRGWNEDVKLVDLAGAVARDLIPPRERIGNPLVGFLLIAVGVFNVAAPGAAWNLCRVWRHKDAEPSKTALVAGGVGGMASILLGLVLCII